MENTFTFDQLKAYFKGNPYKSVIERNNIYGIRIINPNYIDMKYIFNTENSYNWHMSILDEIDANCKHIRLTGVNSNSQIPKEDRTPTIINLFWSDSKTCYEGVYCYDDFGYDSDEVHMNEITTIEITYDTINQINMIKIYYDSDSSKSQYITIEGK